MEPSSHVPYGNGGTPYGAPPNAPHGTSQPAPYGTPQAPYGTPQAAHYSAPPQNAHRGAPQAPPQPTPYGTPQVVQCRFCGCVPAADTTFRGHRGMIVVMSFLHVKGPFCRNCGLSVFRDMTAKTLIGGWWGYVSFIITPITVLINLTRHAKVAGLAAPMPPPGGLPYQRPADPGAPLLTRPIAIIGAMVPLLLLVLVIAVNLGG